MSPKASSMMRPKKNYIPNPLYTMDFFNSTHFYLCRRVPYPVTLFLASAFNGLINLDSFSWIAHVLILLHFEICNNSI